MGGESSGSALQRLETKKPDNNSDNPKKEKVVKAKDPAQAAQKAIEKATLKLAEVEDLQVTLTSSGVCLGCARMYMRASLVFRFEISRNI